VYQYIIKNKINSQQVAKPLIQVSSLNPVSFLAYNGGSNSLDIDLLRTWLCPGFTGHRKETCKSPYKEISLKEISGGKNVKN
jgi:hypothetical protein